METFSLIKAGHSLESIASIRNLKFSTIWSHIEKLVEEGKDIDLSKYRPEDEDRLGQVHRAFVTVGTLSLSPVREYLLDEMEEEYDYDELRMARLFLTSKDRKKIEEQMLYESEGIAF